jgi:hypothetical protein
MFCPFFVATVMGTGCNQFRVLNPVPEFIDPRFRENKPKTLVLSHRKRAYWACFRENCVYNFGHRGQKDTESQIPD